MSFMVLQLLMDIKLLDLTAAAKETLRQRKILKAMMPNSEILPIKPARKCERALTLTSKSITFC